MNLRRCFAPRQLLFLLAAGLLPSGGASALGQETITLRGGQPLPAQILGVTAAGIRVRMGQAEMVEPFANVAQVTMNPPPEFTAAQAAYGSGDLPTALKNALAVVQAYRGLPADWAEQAMMMLGDIYVATGQLDQARQAYADYQRAYPGAATTDVDVGLARIAVAQKDYAGAKAKIDPILAPALQQRNPPAATAALIGRAFYISGMIKEASGDLPGALEDYLRTAAIFPEDRMAAAQAQQRADLLRKDHGTQAP
jgi:tetratricopeptide (TPR) repeat protein